MESIDKRKSARKARTNEGAFGSDAEFINSEKRFPELLADAAAVDAAVAKNRLEAEADRATVVADSLKAATKAAKRADTAKSDGNNDAVSEVKKQGATDAADVPGAVDRNAGNGGGAQWTANKSK